MISRRAFLIFGVATPLALSAVPQTAFSAEPEILSYDGAAIGGYDPVAYFTDAKPVKGDPAHTLTWKGAEWRFASAENLAKFEADPTAFAPKYGGYCAYAAARNYTAPTSANAWSIHEGKLYLNYNRVVRGLWESKKETYISQADANWPQPLSN